MRVCLELAQLLSLALHQLILIEFLCVHASGKHQCKGNRSRMLRVQHYSGSGSERFYQGSQGCPFKILSFKDSFSCWACWPWSHRKDPS